MAHYSLDLARGLGLGKEDCERIERASPMHDIGKIGIPDNILLKPGKLSQSERKIMETHYDEKVEFFNSFLDCRYHAYSMAYYGGEWKEATEKNFHWRMRRKTSFISSVIVSASRDTNGF